MKNIILCFAISASLMVHCLAQTTTTGTASPSPSPIIGWIGIQSGTSYTFFRATKPSWSDSTIFVSGTARPTTAAIALAVAKRSSWQKAQRQYRTAMASGITASGTASPAIILAADSQSQATFTGLMLVLQQTSPPPSSVTITDKGGIGHSLSYMTAYSYLINYGTEIMTLHETLISQQGMIQSATSAAQLP